jgi:hypothetical protein
MAQLSQEEKDALAKISSISLKNYSDIKDIFFSILAYISLDTLFKDDSEIIIPYICKLKFKYEEIAIEQGFESKIIIEAEPLPSLINEFVCIKNGETPPSKRYFRRQNSLEIEKFLKSENIS